MAAELDDDTLLVFVLEVIRQLPGADSVGETPSRGAEGKVKRACDIKVKCRVPGGRAQPHDPDAPMTWIAVSCSTV